MAVIRNFLTLSAVVGAVSADPLVSRATSNTSLYAYGTSASGIGGVPVVYIGGQAYLYSGSSSNSTIHSVTFTVTNRQTPVTATVSGMDSKYFFVPSTSGSTGFTDDTSNSSIITTGFGYYGSVLYVMTDDNMQTEWSALPTSDADIWQLVWDSDDSSAVDVAIRSNAPSS